MSASTLPSQINVKKGEENAMSNWLGYPLRRFIRGHPPDIHRRSVAAPLHVWVAATVEISLSYCIIATSCQKWGSNPRGQF